MSQYTITQSDNCLNTTNSYNTVNNYTVADDRPQLLAWLSPLDPGLRHCDIQERRVNNVGEWLMETEEFRRWCGLGGESEDDKAVLFCYGNPGVGKTFISSLVVDRMCHRVRGQNTAVTCFYFDFAARKEQTATSMLGSLLKQVVSGKGGIPEDIWRALREQRETVSGRRPELGDVVKMLQLITSSQPTFMVIDALDECTAVQRFRLFDSLKEILEKSPGARIFVTGRPHIRTEIETRLAGRVASVSVGPTRGDIVRFLRVRLSEDEMPDAMDESLEADILEKIPENISELFLLASLNIEAILQEPTTYRRRERLNKMTDGLGLGDVYGTMIERIKAQGGYKSRLGIGALMWISHAERPLGPVELCHALAIELDSTDFNPGNVPSIATLVGCCQGLITVDKEGSMVRLIHFTLREYLSAHHDIFGTPHSAMAEICLTYLNSSQAKALSVDPSTNLSTLIDDKPFLRYCSLYWGVHAKKELSECTRSLALQLFREYDGHISAALLVSSVWFRPNFHTGPLWSGLHCASYFGIVDVVAALIKEGCYDLNEGNCWGRTALSLAAEVGHEEVVKMLLGKKEVNPGKPDYHGRIPLSYAAECGDERVVKMLLGQEKVNPDKPDNHGRTPLSYAMKIGDERVVKMLLEQEKVNPDKPDYHCRAPLSYAAWHGHEVVVRILLERGEVNPDRKDDSGQTPLSYAAAYRREGVVKILLARKEVNPGKPDNNGKTPLSYAAEAGGEGVVRILLGREEVNPGKLDDYGRMPLSYAAWRGHEGVVKILLGREEVDPNKPDREGQTPLMLADFWDRQGVIALLRSHEAITHSTT